MIFLLIAGTYTPFALFVLEGTMATVVLVAVWVGALGGALMEVAWIDGPKWLTAAVCIALGWVVVIALPQLVAGLGVAGTVLLATGGILYTAGGIIYAVRRPDPAPTVFGYHELFHLLVVVAVALQYAVIAFYVLPTN